MFLNVRFPENTRFTKTNEAEDKTTYKIAGPLHMIG